MISCNCFTDIWPAIYHQLGVEKENSCLSLLTSHHSNKPKGNEKEVSSSGTASVQTSHSLLQYDNNQNKFLASIGDILLSFFVRKTSNNSTIISESLSDCSISSLFDNSLEHQLKKFESLILRCEWNESSQSASFDSIVQENNQFTDSVNGKTIDFCSGQLLMDTVFQHVEPLKTAVTQSATHHRTPSVGAQKLGSEEEIFSCSSHESLHSFHSVYPVMHNSVSGSESFNSISPELPNLHSTDM
jgi:hypothetical protein